jgi:uncharacterized membrane protein YbhN (UPF0104 family)
MRRPLGSPRRGWLFSGLTTLFCVVGFALWAREQQLPRLSLGTAELAALGVGVAAYTAATVSLCERWILMLRREAPGLSRTVGYRSVALGQIGNAFLPIRAGDAIRIATVSIADDGPSTAAGIGVLVAERTIDFAFHAILLLVVVLAIFGPSLGALGRAPAVVLGLFVSLLAGAMAWRVAIPVLRRARRFTPALLSSLVGLQGRSATVAGISIVLWGSEMIGWWAASYAVGLDLSPVGAAYVFATATLVLTLPIGFGALGTLDAAVLLGITTINVNTDSALSFILLLRLMFVAPSLVIALDVAVLRLVRRRLPGRTPLRRVGSG